MNKIVSNEPKVFVQQNLWAFIVIPVLVALFPYLLIWAIHPAQSIRSFFFDLRLWLTAWIFASGLLCLLKINLVKQGAFRDKQTEKYIDIFLTFFIITAGALLILFSVFALIILFVIARFLAGQTGFWRQVIDGIIYVLANAALFVFGVPLATQGKLTKDAQLVVFNHEGSLDYFIWPVILGWAISKIVLGENLLKFPIFKYFLKLKGVIVKRGDDESNLAQMKEIESCIANKILIGGGPKGRERLSHGGVLKPFESAIFGLVDVVTPVLVLGSGAYKPPAKGEPLAKPLWKFQWYCSPRIVHVLILDPVYPLPDETRRARAKRVHTIMTEAKKDWLEKQKQLALAAQE